ncbi:ABC transporter permease protein [Fimbriiglobus ruber]|uniref:ABC transporter permease protein n=2 Tax=Fimbriiglobus ruber TaxID=1908690 RepID=A0A225DBB0_9BACT|nr:ABC transporter permease protein [Fimbriiglobus ruber]
MPPLYRLLSLRYLVHRWDRAALIVASIAIGVATLVSSRILNQCLETAASQTTTPLGGSDLYVSNGELGVLRTVADDIRAAQIPGVKSVQPLVVERVYVAGGDNRAAVLVGAELSLHVLDSDNPFKARFVRTLENNWTTARLALTRRLVVLSKALFDDWTTRRTGPEDPFVVKYGTREVECLPIGYIEYEDGSPMAALGRNVVGMEIGQAARFVRPGPPPAAAALVGGSASEAAWDTFAPIRVNRIDIVLEPGADAIAAQLAVRAVTADRAIVKTPSAQGQSTQEIVSGLQIGFALCSAGAMIVGLFLVYNALSVTVAERRHDIGILRSLGATRWQIVWLFGSMALVLGLLGAACGVPVGIVMARTILGQFREELGAMFVNPSADPAWPTLATLVLAVLAGVATAVFAALIPAVQAATQDPADAVRRVPGVAGGVWKLAHRAACSALIAGGVAMILTRHDLPPRVGSFGGLMFALVGLLLAAPIIVSLLVRFTHPLLRRVLPIEARLAADNMIRSPGRTGVVIGALAAGVAVMVQTAGVGRSNEEPVVRWLDEVIQADRFVFAGNLTEAASSQTPMDSHVREELARLPGVEGVVGIRYIRPEYNGTVVFMVAIDALSYAEETVKRVPGNKEGLAKLHALPRGNVILVSENFALKHGIKPGDTVTLPGPRGPVALTVLDTIRDYSWTRGTIFIDRAVYAALFQDYLVDVFHVYLSAGAGGAAGESTAGGDAVATFAANRGLNVQDRPTLRRFLAELINRVYTLAFLQQIVVGVVAALGVVTALLISVLQRKRELGLLLAVGATPGQVVRTVLAEAVLMGAFGTVLGVLFGLPMEWYILRVVLVEESGFVFDLIVPWRQGIGIAVGAVAVATLAGLLPALHAIRTRITDAIAYE